MLMQNDEAIIESAVSGIAQTVNRHDAPIQQLIFSGVVPRVIELAEHANESILRVKNLVMCGI
jgi:pyrimidine operon attenuation protein/uracil phosphoribosyltransferase